MLGLEPGEAWESKCANHCAMLPPPPLPQLYSIFACLLLTKISVLLYRPQLLLSKTKHQDSCYNNLRVGATSH